MTTSVVQARIDDKIKREVERDLKSFGLDTATVIRMLFMKIRQTHTLPFSISGPSLDGSNFETDYEYLSQIPGYFEMLNEESKSHERYSLEESGWNL